MGEASRRRALLGDAFGTHMDGGPESEVGPLSEADVRDIRTGKAFRPAERERVAHSAEHLMRTAHWLGKKYQEQFEMNTRTRMRADHAEARNQHLEKEIEALRSLQAQALGDAIFDSYARTWEELKSRIVRLEAELSEAKAARAVA